MTLDLNSLLFGYFYGAMFIVIFYNLVIFLSLRDRTYLYYLLFLTTLTLSTYLWDTWTWTGGTVPAPSLVSWQRWSLPFLDALTAVAAIQFTRSYLAPTCLTPQLDRLLRWLVVAAMLTVLRALLRGWTQQQWWLNCPSLAGPILLLVTGMLCVHQGDRHARIYVAATLALLLGIIIQVVSTLPQFATRSGALWWMEYGVYLGALLMVTIFALGLTERYKVSVQEKEHAEAANRILHIASYTDGMTGVGNRRQFDEQLTVAWQYGANHYTPLSLMLIDIDYFKQYNDAYGHQAGDDCLRRVAQALKGIISRPTDLVARYGGEEFAMLLPSVESHEARAVAEAIRTAVEALRIPHVASDAAPYVTISVGVSTCVPDVQDEVQSFIEAADRALYASKAAGRNRVSDLDNLSEHCQGSLSSEVIHSMER